jgi:hypothetical protein
MDLRTKFQQGTTYNSVQIGSSDVERKYPILHVEKIVTKYRPMVLLQLRDSPNAIFQIFLPKPYSSVFTDDDLGEINSQSLSLYLLYKGKYVKSNS